jgi:hypothetical protein
MFSNYPLYRHAQGVRLELINLRKISQKTPNFEFEIILADSCLGLLSCLGQRRQHNPHKECDYRYYDKKFN